MLEFIVDSLTTKTITYGPAVSLHFSYYIVTTPQISGFRQTAASI
jgi:hypothetical protein